jgi:hypothetical protein
MRAGCIFCGDKPVTREHVFPQWLNGVLPQQQEWRAQERARIFRPGSARRTQLSIPRRRVGKPLTDTQVKVVCRACNNGWMNDIEEQARLCLIPMIRGSSCLIDPRSAASVATWAVKTTMMLEITDLASQAHHTPDYDWVWRERLPPPGTRVWAGLLADTEDWGIRAQHWGLLYGGANIDLPCNSHQTTIGLHHVLLVVVGSRVEGFPYPPLGQVAPLIRLWPGPSAIPWPPPVGIDDAGAWFISEALRISFDD